MCKIGNKVFMCISNSGIKCMGKVCGEVCKK